MKFRTHKIIVFYRQKSLIFNYWADGNGRRVDGYVTSLPQLLMMLHKILGKRPLDLYCVDGLRLRPVIKEKQMRNSLNRVCNRGSICIIAYDHKDGNFVSTNNGFPRRHTRSQTAWIIFSCFFCRLQVKMPLYGKCLR